MKLMKLTVSPFRNDYQDGYRVIWSDGDELGATLGKKKYAFSLLARRSLSREYRDCAIAYLAARDSAGVTRDYEGLRWETRAQAMAALRACNVAIRTDRSTTTWPAWAKRAAAAGWRAPKGWSP